MEQSGSFPLRASFCTLLYLLTRLHQYEIFSQLPAPVFFSELGCNGPRPRRFEEILPLFSKMTTAVLSGACIYQFCGGGSSDWNLVKITEDGEVERLVDFYNLKAKISEAEDQIATTTQPVVTALADGDLISSFPVQTSNWIAGPEIPEPVLDIDEAAENSAELGCH